MAEKLYCGGLADGSQCDVCVFEPGDGGKMPGWTIRVHGLPERKFNALFCLVCGVKLGVGENGRPTRDRMMPAVDLDRIRYIIGRLRQHVQAAAWAANKATERMLEENLVFEEADTDG